MALKKYKVINLTEDKKKFFLMNLLAVGLLFVSFWGFDHLGALTKQLPNQVTVTFGIREKIFMAASLSFLPLKQPVKYDFHGYALSASSPETKYSKGRFIWNGLAPFVIITISLSLALFLNWLTFLAYTFLASFHTSGCIGDFYFTYLLLKETAGILSRRYR